MTARIPASLSGPIVVECVHDDDENATMPLSREDCIRAVAALVMSLQDADAAPVDVVAALEAASRCEDLLRQHVAPRYDDGGLIPVNYALG